MMKKLVFGFLTLAISFFAGISYVSAQTTTTTPSPTPTEEAEAPDEADDSMPSGAPQTGFGN